MKPAQNASAAPLAEGALLPDEGGNQRLMREAIGAPSLASPTLSPAIIRDPIKGVGPSAAIGRHRTPSDTISMQSDAISMKSA